MLHSRQRNRTLSIGRTINKRASPFYSIQYITMVCAGVVACSLLATVVLSGVGPIRAIPLISKEELETKLEAVRGDDMRLMRWDATSHTKKQQKGDGCSVLSQALDVIQHSSDTRMQALACEYATFCVTDNPDNRARLSEHTADNTIHKAIVNVIKSADSHASAMASHLVYIATFANLVNHKGFFRANAVAVLSDVIKAYDPAKSESSPKPDQTMWAAAALQNLAASYCETEGDGRCYWTWAWQDHPNVADDSLPVFSEGSSVRRTAMKDEELYEKLGSLVCQGPVKGEMSDENPFPGDNAVIGKHDSSPNSTLLLSCQRTTDTLSSSVMFLTRVVVIVIIQLLRGLQPGR